MTLISQETLKELEETLPRSPKYVSCHTDVAKQLIHDAKVAAICHKAVMDCYDRPLDMIQTIDWALKNLKELDELEKE